MSDFWLREERGGVTFRVHIQPRAAKNRVQGIYDEALKMSLTAPPVEGAANRLLRDFLARLLQCPKNRVAVVAGHKSRRKTVHVEGLSGPQLLARLSF